MEHRPDQFTFYACQIAFVSIVGDCLPARRIAISYSRRDALDDLIAYLNMMMAETVLADGASEDEVRNAFEEHLAQPIEIVECE